ncbi:MAG: chitosanase [Acidobacteria bacterium]|nr:chitosanase [Acidobacteriota bacterium]
MQENISQMKRGGFSSAEIAAAAAIVRVFETGTPVGNYSEVAVLNDGAGISYGISQFTHRSGSLAEVVSRYLASGGVAGRDVFASRLPMLRDRSATAIAKLTADRDFRRALAAAGHTREMREVQDAVAFERYMLPAIRACEGSGFRLPLSLAVIYDSMTHGSYNKIRDRVRISPAGKGDFEKSWITAYVRERDAWLGSIPRLRSTRYRTRFFMNQIATGRWGLELPINVHGALITNEILGISPDASGKSGTTAGPNHPPQTMQNEAPQLPATQPADNPQARPPVSANEVLGRVERGFERAAESFDRVERIGLGAANRTDRAKSLWATVAGTVWQTLWAAVGFLAGLPREVWLVVAVIAAVFTLAYLYRQITLGRLRELKETI